MSIQCQDNTLIGRLFHHAKTKPSHDAIVTTTFTLSYVQLAQLVLAQVEKYHAVGISENAVIGIKCADDTQHLVLCLAATYLGATSCTIPTHETEPTQKAMISRCGASHVVDKSIAIEPMSLDSLTQPAVIPTPASEARLLFSTSGTTGEPKLVVHHDSDLVAQAHRHIGTEQERFACLALIEHNFAKRHRLYCVAAGATNVFIDNEKQSLSAQCQTLNVNVMHVSAFQAQGLLAAPDIFLLANIRLKLGGSHVSATLRQQLRDNITNNLQAGYGTTETGAIAFTDPNDSSADESVGKPLPGIEIRVVTPERKPLAIGERGELAIRCAGMFREYLGKAELTNTRLEDGWFYTGDIGYLDEQRRIHLCGRSDDMFMFNSMNIYPQEIESQLCQYPSVIDAAVLPKVSSVHGNIPVALVVFAEGVKPDLSTLKKFMREQVGVRSPRQFTIVEKIPRNASGKISRRDAVNLSTENEQIRHSIVQALANARRTNKLPSSLITAFENGDEDITLREIGMDSLARMELLVALEINHNTVVTPQEFARFSSLDDIVSHVLSPPSKNELEQETNPAIDNASLTLSEIKKQPYVVRFFQRVFHYCHTVAHLNKALITLEQRLTPTEIKCLHDWHLNGHLIPASAAKKFHTALSNCLHDMTRMMSGSGKQQAEPFVSRKISPHVTHFSSPGSPADKTLLICFSIQGDRRLMMPNAVLMQHIDAAHYDLLIIAEPLGESYQRGVPQLGTNVIEVIEWLARLELIGNYKHTRTMGCSAGCYPALIAGHLLGAEIALSVGGRFPSERHPIRILKMIFTTWRAIRKGHCSRVLMSYAADNNRDRRYTKVMSKLCSSSVVAVEINNEIIGHRILQRLVERGELAPYLARTIFAEMNDELIATERANVIMNFPTTQMRPRDSHA